MLSAGARVRLDELPETRVELRRRGENLDAPASSTSGVDGRAVESISSSSSTGSAADDAARALAKVSPTPISGDSAFSEETRVATTSGDLEHKLREIEEELLTTQLCSNAPCSRQDTLSAAADRTCDSTFADTQNESFAPRAGKPSPDLNFFDPLSQLSPSSRSGANDVTRSFILRKSHSTGNLAGQQPLPVVPAGSYQYAAAESQNGRTAWHQRMGPTQRDFEPVPPCLATMASHHSPNSDVYAPHNCHAHAYPHQMSMPPQLCYAVHHGVPGQIRRVLTPTPRQHHTNGHDVDDARTCTQAARRAESLDDDDDEEDDDDNDDRQLLTQREAYIDPAASRRKVVQFSTLPTCPAQEAQAAAAANKTAEEALHDGVVFRAHYLGSTHLFCESRVSRATRLAQCQEALSRIKAPDGESQPMTEVNVFISTEKVAVVMADTIIAAESGEADAASGSKQLMEHPLRSISYTADIGDLVVLMVKRALDELGPSPADDELDDPTTDDSDRPSTANQPAAYVAATQPKMLCHVLQANEASTIAQCIGQAFQLAYVDFLRANGVHDERYLRMMDYQEVLNAQELISDELDLFARRERHKDIIVPKKKGEALGVVIVESGWGSIVPTVVLANLCPTGAAARTGRLNIGDQLLSVDGISFVGLPLRKCQQYVKETRPKTAVKLTLVPTSPVVSVRIRRPDTRYQLGFSVQNGVICSLLRGGIAERGGIRVGHRIIEINGQSVVSTSHEQIVSMLAHSIGDIHIKTMPTSIYRLLTGQEQPVYI